MIYKKAKMGIEQIIYAGIVLVVVFSVLLWSTGAFASIANSLGFDVGLEQPKDDESKEVFLDYFNDPLLNCKSSLNTSCFCDLSDFSVKSLPNGYILELSEDSGATKIVLKNSKGAKLSEKWLTNVKPCVTAPNGRIDYLSDISKDGKLEITFGSINKLSYDIKTGDQFEASISKSNFVYKEEEGVFCIVVPGYKPQSPVCD